MHHCVLAADAGMCHSHSVCGRTAGDIQAGTHRAGRQTVLHIQVQEHVRGRGKDEPALLETDSDPRITRTGRFLRSHHLDELPQLWNVFTGDMSFVGPRPERRYFIEKIMEHDPRYERLYVIRPGVTSYATLHNGYTDTMEKMLRRLEMDLYYLEHRSMCMDMKILAGTFISIVGGKKF